MTPLRSLFAALLLPLCATAAAPPFPLLFSSNKRMEALPVESLSEFLENLGYMTFSHEGFWAVLAVVVAVVVIYQLLGAFAPKTIAPVRGFFKRHPLVWLLIPAALLSAAPPSS